MVLARPRDRHDGREFEGLRKLSGRKGAVESIQETILQQGCGVLEKPAGKFVEPRRGFFKARKGGLELLIGDRAVVRMGRLAGGKESRRVGAEISRVV